MLCKMHKAPAAILVEPQNLTNLLLGVISEDKQ